MEELKEFIENEIDELNNQMRSAQSNNNGNHLHHLKGKKEAFNLVKEKIDEINKK